MDSIYFLKLEIYTKDDGKFDYRISSQEYFCRKETVQKKFLVVDPQNGEIGLSVFKNIIDNHNRIKEVYAIDCKNYTLSMYSSETKKEENLKFLISDMKRRFTEMNKLNERRLLFMESNLPLPYVIPH